MQTDVLNLRIPREDALILKQAAAKCQISANALGAMMLRAAVSAIKDYDGPILPLTLEFPHKVPIPTKSKK